MSVDSTTVTAPRDSQSAISVEGGASPGRAKYTDPMSDARGPKRIFRWRALDAAIAEAVDLAKRDGDVDACALAVILYNLRQSLMEPVQPINGDDSASEG
jgi:hypothetical protein